MNGRTGETPTPIPTTPSPAQRLEASRARIRKAWIGEPSAPREPDDAKDFEGSPFERLSDLLAAGWARHPLKAQLDAALDVLAPAARSTLSPLVQRHPLRLLALAAGIGALTIWLRPWRWLPRAALGSALLSAVLPRQAILAWFTSGRWLEVLRAENLEAWFGRSRSTATPADDTPAAAADAMPSEPDKPPMSETPAPPQERASYAAPAPAPISGESAHS